MLTAVTRRDVHITFVCGIAPLLTRLAAFQLDRVKQALDGYHRHGGDGDAVAWPHVREVAQLLLAISLTDGHSWARRAIAACASSQVRYKTHGLFQCPNNADVAAGPHGTGLCIILFVIR